MKSFKGLLLIAVFAATCALAAGQTPSKAFFQKYYDHYDALTKKRDVTSLERIIRSTYTRDYVGIDSKNDRTDIEAEIKAIKTINRLTARFDEISSQVLRVAGTKDTASVTVRGVFAATVIAKRKGASHSFKETVVGVDTWVRVHGKWMLKSSVVQSTKKFRDGKPVQ